MEGTTAGETRSFGGIEMVWCPPGEFLMGSPESEDVYEYNETQHRVTLTKGFWLAMTECTQRQWESVMGTDVDRLKGTAAEDATFGDVNAVGPAVAMYFTSWNDAQDWLGEMNQTQPLPAGWKWTLPTEAQWEYACRAGTKTETYAGPLVVQGIHNAPTLDSIAWYSGNSSVSYTGEGTETGDWEEKQYPGGTAGVRQVGLKQPNAWGLHDMLGNVWEWCADWRGDYSNTSVADPRGETDGTLRVDRGGGWYGYSWDCRSPARGSMSPETRGDYLGFRPAASFQGFQ
jgi:formylglycine-generating enzyme required for sulfatase activity